MIKEFDSSNFEKEVAEASKQKPVLVDFFAPWCGTCKMVSPLFEMVAGEAGDKAVFGKADIDASPELSEKYEVMSLPTIMVFKNGQPAGSISGIQSKEAIEKLLE